jgi:hypothetical protein
MQGKIDCREDTASFWDDYRVDFDEGEEIQPDQDVTHEVLRYAIENGGLPLGTTAEIVERGDRHLIVRVTYPPLDIVPSGDPERITWHARSRNRRRNRRNGNTR